MENSWVMQLESCYLFMYIRDASISWPTFTIIQYTNLDQSQSVIENYRISKKNPIHIPVFVSYSFYVFSWLWEQLS